MKDEKVRDGLIEAVKDPIKTAQGIYESKRTAYFEEADVEVIYNTAAIDGTSLVIALITGSILTKLDDYVRSLSKKADDTADKLADELGDIPTNKGGPEYDEYHRETNKLEVTPPDIDEPKEFFKFLGDIDPVHRAKFVRHRRLINVWKKFKDNPDIDMKKIAEKMPEPGSDFYDRFFNVIMDGDNFLDIPHAKTGVLFNKAEAMLKDLQGNTDLLNLFNAVPQKVRAWDMLLSRGLDGKFKKDIPTLDKVNNLLNDNEFLERLSGSTDIAIQREALQKALTHKSQSFRRNGDGQMIDVDGNVTTDPAQALLSEGLHPNAGCGSCGNTGSKYLSNMDDYLESIRNFAEKHAGKPGAGPGSGTLMSQLQNGTPFQIDEVAQTFRRIKENPGNIFNDDNVVGFGGTIGNTNKRYDIELVDDINNPNALRFVEQKSRKKSSISSLGGSQFVGQFKAYLSTITNINQLRYSFDKKKLLEPSGTFPDTSNGLDAANALVKEKMNAILETNAPAILGEMNIDLKLSLGISTLANSFTNAQKTIIVNAITKVE